MEENLERTFVLLDKWMELKRIPREKQKEYYHKLVISLEKKEKKLREKLICFTTGSMAFSSSLTCYVLGNDKMDYVLATFFLFFSIIIGTIPFRMEDIEDIIDLEQTEQYGEIEKQRRIIKQKFEKRKD